MDEPIEPIQQQPTDIKTAYYYRLKRALEREIGLPMDKTFCEWLGIDYGDPRGDYTVKTCSKCGTSIYIARDGVERHLCG